LIAPHVALALVRLCFDAAAIAACGVSGFIAWIAPNRLGLAIAASSNFLIVAASSLAVLSTLAWLPIEAAMIGDSWQSAVDRSTLSVILCDTAIGKAWLVRLALSLLLMAALPWRSGSIVRWALSGFLTSLALTGHADMDEGTRGVLHILNDALHVWPAEPGSARCSFCRAVSPACATLPSARMPSPRSAGFRRRVILRLRW
jgi:copper resistance protein D